MRDFSSQWFQLDHVWQVDEEKELYWHLNHLKDNSLPHEIYYTHFSLSEILSKGGGNAVTMILQPSEMMPLVFDYAWLMDGRFAFYLVDSSDGGENGVGTALLIRALFNDFLRTPKALPFRFERFSRCGRKRRSVVPNVQTLLMHYLVLPIWSKARSLFCRQE